MQKRDIPVLARLVVFQLVLDHADHDVVTDKPTSIHNILRLHTESGLLRDLFAKHIARGEMAYAVGLGNPRCLSTLP